MRKKCRKFKRGVRASRRMRTVTARGLMLRDASPRSRLVQASVLALRCSSACGRGAFWRNEANGVLADEATGKDQPAAATNGRRLRTIVSRLLSTMNRATCARTGQRRILAKRTQRAFWRNEANAILAKATSSSLRESHNKSANRSSFTSFKRMSPATN